MGSFEDELARQAGAGEAAAAQAAGQASALEHHGAAAADELKVGLRKLARHLADQSPPRQYTIIPRRNWRTPAVTSPAGFAISGGWTGRKPHHLDSLEVLLPDGEIWYQYGRKPGAVKDLRADLTRSGSTSVGHIYFRIDRDTGALFADEYSFSSENYVRVSIDKVLAQWAIQFKTRGIAAGPLDLPEIG